MIGLFMPGDLQTLYLSKIHIEENNRMGKTRDLFKKTGSIKGIFHARKGTIKTGVARP